MRPHWVLLLLASCATPPAPPPPPDDAPWLALELPERVRSSVALAEFRGRVAGPELSGADVVLVIDLTNTTLEASGVDVDRDGTVGETRSWAEMKTGSNARWQRPARTWTSDYDDSIVGAELETARRLIDALEQRHCRVGIVTFTGRARVLREVGPAADARQALEGLRVSVDRSGTLPKLALKRGGRLLDDAPPERSPRRRPVLIFLSDGARTNRDQQRILRDTERMAAELAGGGAVVHALGFGTDDAEDPEDMARIAAFGRGRYLHVAHPEDALALVAPEREIALVPVKNRARPDAPARAVRSFADGTFDGFVQLVPGENEIDVEVVLSDGQRVSARHVLYYEPADPSPADAELLATLRDRTTETALAGESQTGSTAPRGELEIRGEPGETSGKPR